MIIPFNETNAKTLAAPRRTARTWLGANSFEHGGAGRVDLRQTLRRNILAPGDDPIGKVDIATATLPLVHTETAGTAGANIKSVAVAVRTEEDVITLGLDQRGK